MRSALKTWWNLPKAPDNPGVLWWDRWLVGVAVLAVIIEGIVRPDMPWRPLGVALGIVFAFALLWRRTHPLTTTAVVFGLVSIFSVLAIINPDWRWEIFATAFVLLFPYTLMRWGSGREQWIGLAFIWLTYALTIPESEGLDEIIGGAIVLALPAVIGAEVRAMSTRRKRKIEQVRLVERGVLARELHDTVAHHVSAIAIQAQAGKELAKTDRDGALETLSIIEAEASRTLEEMRVMVGALRDSEEAELKPGGGVGDLQALAASAGDTPPVEVELSGELSNLSPAVDSALYRLAQESITNAVRHARSATRIQVKIIGETDSVRIEVDDDGEPLVSSGEPGYGLVGMDERARLLGGTFRAGPKRDRGWRVNAQLPRKGAPT